jgi:SAM-dependent methyltransferase
MASDIRLDLGCGYYKREGFVGIDNLIGAESQVRRQNSGPDVIADLSAGIPLADASVAEVFASHFLEHVPIDRLLKEMFRVLRPDGKAEIILPYANSAQGMYPGHTAFYTEQWFRENLLFQGLFCITKIGWRKTPVFDQLPRGLRRDFSLARQVLFNVCDEMSIFCIPRKQAGIDYARVVADEFVYALPQPPLGPVGKTLSRYVRETYPELHQMIVKRMLRR